LNATNLKLYENFFVQAASVCFKDFQITEWLTIITENLVHSWWVYKCFKDEAFG
jgi:hypothetical protein